MPSLDLTKAQAALLEEYLERVLSDLSVEIAGTDRKDYREEIKLERRLLQQVQERLGSLTDSSTQPSAKH